MFFIGHQAEASLLKISEHNSEKQLCYSIQFIGRIWYIYTKRGLVYYLTLIYSILGRKVLTHCVLNLSKGEENLCPLAYVQYIWSRVRYPIFWRTNTGYTIAAFYIMLLLLLHQCLAVPDFYRSDTPGIFWYQNSKFIEIEMYFCNFKKRYILILRYFCTLYL